MDFAVTSPGPYDITYLKSSHVFQIEYQMQNHALTY